MKTEAPCPSYLPIPHLYFIQNFSNLVTFVCLKEKSLKIK
nr:MAG TPA: Non-structural protein 9 binding protein.9A [Caudoviricetes sp.]